MSLRTRTQDAAFRLAIEAEPGVFVTPTDMIEAAGGLIGPVNARTLPLNTFTGSIIARIDEIATVPIGGSLEVPLKATTLSGGLVLSPEWTPWARIGGWEPVPATATAVADGGNTGNGTMSAVTVSAGARLGAHVLTITGTGATAAFSVVDPDGKTVGTGNVGTAFAAGGLAFTLSDGATDFDPGDFFTITTAPDAAIGSTTVQSTSLVSGRRVFTVDRTVDTDWPAATDAMVGRRILVDGISRVCLAYVVAGDIATVTLAERFTMTTGSPVTAPAALRFKLNDNPVTGSFRLYRENDVWSGNGAQSDSTLQCDAGGRWSLNGQILARSEGDPNPTTGTVPADETDQTVIKPRWEEGRALIDGYEVAVSDASVALQAPPYQMPNPNQKEALEAACITRMQPIVRMSPALTDPTTLNIFQRYRDNGRMDVVFATDLTKAAGEILTLVAPLTGVTDTNREDGDGFLRMPTTFQIDGSKGAVLCIS